MALMLLVMLSAYLRPSEALNMKRGDLVPPVSGVSSHWSLLLFREEHGLTSKTGETDDSILLDHEWLKFAEPLLEILHKGPEGQRVWSFRYDQFLREFRTSARRLGVELVPYQARHSGASLDRVDNRRPQLEVQKRGRWRSYKSLVRYEKAGRLQYTAAQASPQLRAYTEACAARLAPLMLGVDASIPVPPFT